MIIYEQSEIAQTKWWSKMYNNVYRVTKGDKLYLGGMHPPFREFLRWVLWILKALVLGFRGKLCSKSTYYTRPSLVNERGCFLQAKKLLQLEVLRAFFFFFVIKNKRFLSWKWKTRSEKVFTVINNYDVLFTSVFRISRSMKIK